MPLTEIIAEELLATLDGEGDPQVVLDRHAGSKGPLYVALARVTVQATVRLGEVRAKLRDAQTRLQTAESRIADAEKRAGQAKREFAAAEKRRAAAEADIARRQMLIDRADALRASGFDAAMLTRLGEVLGAAAQAEGKPVAEVVPRFLDAAADWRTLAELRGRIAGAEKAAHEAERQAKRRRREANLSDRAVNAGRWLIRNNVTVTTTAAWRAAAEQIGFTAESLAAGLAHALEEYGTTEAVRLASAKAVADLRAEQATLTAEVTALRHEREHITAAIGAVRTAGFRAVQEVAAEAAVEVATAADQFVTVSKEAAALAAHVRLAKALVDSNPDGWRGVRPEQWDMLLARFSDWAQVQRVDAAELEPPAATGRQLREQAAFPNTKGPLRLSLAQLLEWVGSGLRSPAVKAAITALGHERPSRTGSTP